MSDATEEDLAVVEVCSPTARSRGLINELQWPAMAMSLIGAWLVADPRQGMHCAGFVCFLWANVLWLVWGVNTRAWALVLMQILFTVTSIRGIATNWSPAESVREPARSGVGSATEDDELARSIVDWLRPPARSLEGVDHRSHLIGELGDPLPFFGQVLRADRVALGIEQASDEQQHGRIDLTGSGVVKIHKALVVEAIIPMGVSPSNRQVDIPYLGRGGA